MMYVLKGLCVIGIVLTLFLMYKKTKEMLANPEKDPVTGMTGKELWEFGKKKAVITAIIGFELTSLIHLVSVHLLQHLQHSK